jgi:hypothetical protein
MLQLGLPNVPKKMAPSPPPKKKQHEHTHELINMNHAMSLCYVADIRNLIAGTVTMDLLTLLTCE